MQISQPGTAIVMAKPDCGMTIGPLVAGGGCLIRVLPARQRSSPLSRRWLTTCSARSSGSLPKASR